MTTLISEEMIAFFDGDQICITARDFRNLQESPAVFIGPDTWLYILLSPWVGVSSDPLCHVPLFWLLDIAKTLGIEGER